MSAEYASNNYRAIGENQNELSVGDEHPDIQRAGYEVQSNASLDHAVHRPNLDWQEQALCLKVNPDMFYPELNTEWTSARIAKKVCKMCNVRLECLQYAFGNKEKFGVWGGLSENDRRKLKSF